MMKFGIIFCAVLILKIVHSEYVDMATLHSCKIQENATDEDVEDYLGAIIRTPKVKCLDACVSERMEWIVDGIVNVAVLEKVGESLSNDQAKIAEYKDVLNECKSVTDPDRCEMSDKLANCLKDAVNRRYDITR